MVTELEKLKKRNLANRKKDSDKLQAQAEGRGKRTDVKIIEGARATTKGVGQREKDIHKALSAGATRKEAVGIASEQFGALKEREDERARQLALEQTEKQRQAELLPVAEETGVFEESPERVELDVSPGEKVAQEHIPLIGSIITPMVNAVTGILGQNEYKGLTNDDKLVYSQTPEGRRVVMINEIRKQELNKAVTATEAVGVAAEALGLTRITTLNIGETVEQFVKTPSADVETFRESIRLVEGRASAMTDAASQGELGDTADVLRKLSNMDYEIAKSEAKIKFMITNSATLQADPEEVNLIEEEILKARETIFEAKQRAAEGALITPSEEQLYYKLQQIKNE